MVNYDHDALTVVFVPPELFTLQEVRMIFTAPDSGSDKLVFLSSSGGWFSVKSINPLSPCKRRPKSRARQAVRHSENSRCQAHTAAATTMKQEETWRI